MAKILTVWIGICILAWGGSWQSRFDKKAEAYRMTHDEGLLLLALTDVDTGHIVAYATSMHAFEPAGMKKKEPYWHDPALAHTLLFPGGLMKPITLAVALETGMIDAMGYRYAPKTLQVGKAVVKDKNATEAFGIADILRSKSHTVTAQIATELDENTWLLLLRKLNFGKAIAMDITVPEELAASKGVLPSLEHLVSSEPVKVALANGYAVQATPIQLIAAYSAMLNGGYVLRPHLLKQTPADKRRVLSEKTAHAMRQALHDAGDEVCTHTRFVKQGRFVIGTYNTLCMRVVLEEGKTYLQTKMVLRQPTIWRD